MEMKLKLPLRDVSRETLESFLEKAPVEATLTVQIHRGMDSQQYGTRDSAELLATWEV